MTSSLTKLAVAVVAAVPHHHHAAPDSPPLTSHTDPNGANFKLHSGVSLHRAVQTIRRLQHLHREHRRAERKAIEQAQGPTSLSVGTGGLPRPIPAPAESSLPACTWRPESGGSYTAMNPSSGAYGKYQVIPSTWAALCSDLGRDPAGQDECAGRVYRSQGAGAWVNC